MLIDSCFLFIMCFMSAIKHMIVDEIFFVSMLQIIY